MNYFNGDFDLVNEDLHEANAGAKGISRFS